MPAKSQGYRRSSPYPPRRASRGAHAFTEPAPPPPPPAAAASLAAASSSPAALLPSGGLPVIPPCALHAARPPINVATPPLVPMLHAAHPAPPRHLVMPTPDMTLDELGHVATQALAIMRAGHSMAAALGQDPPALVAANVVARHEGTDLHAAVEYTACRTFSRALSEAQQRRCRAMRLNNALINKARARIREYAASFLAPTVNACPPV